MRYLIELLLILVCVKAYAAAFGTEQLTSQVPYQLIYSEQVYGRAKSKQLPMVLFFHGQHRDESYGLDVFDKLGVDDAGFPAIRLISFRANWTQMGRYYWANDQKLMESVVAGARELVRRYPTRGKPILMGFGFGGAVVYDLAAQYGDMFSAAFVVDGNISGSFKEGLPGSGAKPVFHIYHELYNADSTTGVPEIEKVRAFVANLKETHYEADLHEIQGSNYMNFALSHAISHDLEQQIFRSEL